MKKTAILLAAGKGERLRPLTSTRPKPSIPVGGTPIICRHLSVLSRFADEVIVVVNYMAEKLKEISANCREYLLMDNTHIRFVSQGKELGTGDAVRKALASSTIDDLKEVIVSYSDVQIPFSVYEKFLLSQGEILAVETETPWEYGVFELDSFGYIKSVVEKPPLGKEPSNLIFGGLLKISKEDISAIDKLELSPRGEYELTDAITVIGKERGLKPFSIRKNEWTDIGRPWDLLEANIASIKECISSYCPLADEYLIKESDNGEPYISHKEAYRERHTVILGPAFLSKHCRLKSFSLVRDFTMLSPGAVVGVHTEIKNSILMENSKVPHQTYVGDSIIGEHVNLGAGTQIANLRFDDKPVKMTIKGSRVSSGRRKLGAVIGGYAKTGIGVLIYPGVKIGAYSWVYPGCIVSRDVPDNHRYTCTDT